MKDRVCAEKGCTTILSVYNLTACCWVHSPRRPSGEGSRFDLNNVTAPRRASTTKGVRSDASHRVRV